MNDRTTDTSAAPSGAKVLNRRKIMKLAIATAPIIATLPSGAALARSSNVIGASSATAAKDPQGRTQCLDLNSGAPNATNTLIDLGPHPQGALTKIKDRDYRVDNKWSAAKITEADMCKKGGSSYHYANGSWRKVTVPKGMLVSATALSSFAGSIYTTEV
jgi:hypothetical protein